jgi:hypothetical protein
VAFDVYVGPASRYQAGDWKNVVQQEAHARGISYIKVGPRQGILSGLFKPNPAKAYQRWREDIRAAITSAGFSEPVWDDSAQQDYVTDRPGWDGHVALIAQYAYAKNPELSPPAKALTIPELEEDPAFIKEAEIQGSPATVLLTTQFFLPGTFKYAFQVKSFFGGPAGVASLDVLDHVLDTVCTHGGLERKDLSRTPIDQPDDDATFTEVGLYGVSIYARLVGEALARNLPLILDF